jgi:hypothetical protein
MGRGRAKAKQTKVARELKYNSAPNWDPSALEGELRGNGQSSNGHATKAPEGDDYVDPYADDPYADEDEAPPQRK